ncbi:single-stranded DNA-binding protein [Nonomuraea sp. NPDC048916]|uniref:single-stranded DNA-binding protein n=1 Tax=Nonomuraea sp. NPDC048916 TaxID=3154232 RepID=UPI0033F2C6D8
MDRNEVVLVGRLSMAAEDKTLPSGDTLTKWRLVVRRRRRHKRGEALTDSIPCVTFNPEAAAIVHSLNLHDTLEVTGAFRCRIYGPSTAKVWRYEVEVVTAKAVDAASPAAEETAEVMAADLGARPPRPVASLAQVG